jgi:hypothetical protein
MDASVPAQGLRIFIAISPLKSRPLGWLLGACSRKNRIAPGIPPSGHMSGGARGRGGGFCVQLLFLWVSPAQDSGVDEGLGPNQCGVSSYET